MADLLVKKLTAEDYNAEKCECGGAAAAWRQGRVPGCQWGGVGVGHGRRGDAGGLKRRV